MHYVDAGCIYHLAMGGHKTGKILGESQCRRGARLGPLPAASGRGFLH